MLIKDNDVEQKHENINSHETNTNSQNDSSEFVDKSPEAAEAQKLQETANNSPETLEMLEWQNQIAPEENNNSQIPPALLQKIQEESGVSLADVQIHYNSSKPSEVDALAYTKGNHIYIGPGNEQYLEEELWHVVQQKMGRVKATEELNGNKLNTDQNLEDEAQSGSLKSAPINKQNNSNDTDVIQRATASIDKTTPDTKLSGFSDKANALKKQNTDVHYKTDVLQTTGEKVGVGMVAKVLGPDHPQGSGPDTSVTKKHIVEREKATGEKYIRGHLLNGDLGGPGEAENLFPITAQANALHYQKIEKMAKSIVNDDKGYIQYSVNVTNRDDKNGTALFECQLTGLDDKGNPAGVQLKADILSKPSASAFKAEAKKLGNNYAKDNSFGDEDIEYQKGKTPVGYQPLEDAVQDQMESDDTQVLERNLAKIGISKQGIDEIWLYVKSGDDAVFKNQNKGTWNRWCKVINEKYL